ncbi:hypothetical protein KHHGKMAE_1491 [Methylobacterium persicinum]|nr:hypothetical protein KHHGKMAE_1491 [Methylobacterium persicinum]
MFRKLILSFLLVLASVAGVRAQFIERRNVPVNINDCTFVRDPTILRDCIDLIQGQRLGPPIDRSPSDPIVSSKLLRQAGPIPAGNRRADRRERARSPVRPVAFDPVRVEQVAPLRRGARAQ